MATLKEIAREANVSESLVSRLLNGDPMLRVREDKRQRIVQAEAKLGGYQAHQAARSLATRRAHNLVMPLKRNYSLDWLQANIGSDQITRRLEAVSRERGFRLSMSFFDEPDKLDLVHDLVTSRGHCDGVVLLNGVADESIAELLRREQFPHVSTDIRDEARGLNVVCDDALAGMRQAVRHLEDLGHARIGFLGMSWQGTGPPPLRYELFRRVMRENGWEPDERLDCRLPPPSNEWTDARWHESERSAIEQYFERADRAEAVICQDDQVALETMAVMRGRGLKPGRDLSLVGYDNIEGRSDRGGQLPQLTTVDNPRAEIGEHAAQLMLNQVLHDQRTLVQEHLEVELVLRDSTGPANPADGEKPASTRLAGTAC